jgi:hypothetical protein
MSAVGGESNFNVAGKTAIRSTKMMISSLLLKVNLSHPADLAVHRDCCLVKAAAKDWQGIFLSDLISIDQS